MSNEKKKFMTIGQIDATGVRGPHEKELEDISNIKYSLFVDLNMEKLKKIVEEDLGAKIENIGFSEDWTITIEMFPEVMIHMSFSYFGDEFGDSVDEAEFKFYFSGERVYWVPGEDSATFIDIAMDFLEGRIKNKSPFEKEYDKKTDLMKKVLIQREKPFHLLTENDKDKLASFLGAKVWKTSDGWRFKKELFSKIFIEITWNSQSGLDISFSGEKLENISSYHVEFIGIFIINHILRYIMVNNQDKALPDICYIMFSRLYTKEKGWDHRTR